MRLNKPILGVAILVAGLLSACGGGGGGSSSGGNSSNLMSNDVAVGTTSLKAGQSTNLTAHAIIRGAAPNAMVWTASPITAMGPTDLPLLINDIKCSSASYSPPAVAGASGEGFCQVVLTAPVGAKSGVWRLTNTASTASSGSVSNSIDVTVSALPESGFRLVESSTPITGYTGKAVSLNLPFTVNPGATVSNVTYKWTASTQNPSTIAIAGSRNSIATVIPLAPGQYSFDAAVSANVNGNTETATGSVVLSVYPSNVTDVIDAGPAQIVTTGSTAQLTGAILNRDNSLTYTTSWTQLSGAAGGPVPVTLANSNSTAASFIVPSTIGTYGFEFKVVKYLPDGTQSITTAQTSVLVQAVGATSGVFTLTAGDAQTVVTGKVVTLKGSVGVQGSVTGVTYAYNWTQVGATPAAVTLSNSNTSTATFIPTVAGTYTFNLTVIATTTTGAATTISGVTQVVASATSGSSANIALSASAGPAQSVAPSAIATLTGSQTTQGSSTGVTYAYEWTQIGALPAAVTLSNANTTTATFMPTVAGTYGFRLTVTATLPDATVRTATSDTQVIVGGIGNTFTVSAGNAQAVTVNTAASMLGVVSTQGTFTGATFSYEWVQVGAVPAAVTVSNATSTTASFVPTVTGTYTFMLTVTAVQGGVTTTKTAQTQVLVTP